MSELDRSASSSIPLSEWIFGTVGFLLFCATAGFLLYQALAGSNAPPEIEVRAKRIVSLQNGYLVELLATNRGGRTGAEVRVLGELKNGSQTLEAREITLQYVPPRSERKGGLYFERDPRTLELVLSVRSYVDP